MASNAPVYTRCSLLVADGPKPPVHRRNCVRCTSRRWRLLVYWQGRTPLAEPPPEGARLPSGSTTISPWQVVGQCALREGRKREGSAQVISGRSRFGSLLLVDHRPSNLYHSATNEPQSMYCSGLVKTPFIHYISKTNTVACGRSIRRFANRITGTLQNA